MFAKSNLKRNLLRPSRRQLGLAQVSQLAFQRLEDRQLLAAITVNNAADVFSPTADMSSITALIANDGGDGISLREAIAATNNTIGDDTISFDGTVFTGGVNSLIRLAQGELQITDSLTIDASSATEVTITADANGDDITLPGTFVTDVEASFNGTPGGEDDFLDDNSRVINFFSAFSDDGGALTLSDLTVTGGRTTATRSRGAGILSPSGTVSIINSNVSGNSTAGNDSDGGGIAAFNGDIFLTNATVSGNSTDGFNSEGGGIFARFGNVTLINSTLIGNSATRDFSIASAGGGGGISATSGDVSVTNSIVSGNSADFEGGGILAAFGSVTVTDQQYHRKQYDR